VFSIDSGDMLGRVFLIVKEKGLRIKRPGACSGIAVCDDLQEAAAVVASVAIVEDTVDSFEPIALGKLLDEETDIFATNCPSAPDIERMFRFLELVSREHRYQKGRLPCRLLTDASKRQAEHGRAALSELLRFE
jgi:hypothetical protein